MASMSATSIAERAMVKARIIYPGEAVPAAKLTQVLTELNDMLESWALEKLMVASDVLESFALTVAQAEYTYGTGGDFDSARPIEIKDESFIRGGSTDYPVHLVTLDVYRRQHSKSTGARPRILAYTPEYPLGKAFLWPTPTSTDSLYLRVAKTVTEFADETTAVDLEPGYSRAIIANLAMEICPNFGKKIPEALAFLAGQSKQAIKSANSIPVKQLSTSELQSMAGNGRYGDINSGPFG